MPAYRRDFLALAASGAVAHNQLGRTGIVLGGRIDLYVDAAEVSIDHALLGIAGDQVLRAQLIALILDEGFVLTGASHGNAVFH